MDNYRSFYSDITEDYPQSWNKEEFKKIRSFAGKLRYANERLEKLASGSSRSVFKIDDQKALKIAKNKKGLAQNNVETDGFIQHYDIVAKTYDVGEDVGDLGPFWVEMELAKKVTPTRFRSLLGIDIKDLGNYLVYVDKVYPAGWYVNSKSEIELKEKIESSEFVSELLDLNGNMDMETGDESRLSTYGEVTRDGKPTLVLVDFGLTKSVYNDFYKVNPFSPYHP